ncbi:hypothetical protein GCM10020367_33920 [Streptomyces sannanensis]|uniref:DUF397 domain-containing protein n=1 Tax=Streptomyces sannanensis TaxID=285536 RepID=A0ABP6SE02_9ACTN
MPKLHWQKSSYSEDQANCLHLAAAPNGTVRLRESDEPDVILTTTPARLAALIRHIQRSGRRAAASDALTP